MVNSFNYGFQKGELTISQRQSIIRLIPKKDKDLSRLKNWRPISLLNLDYKIATKALALRLKKVLPSIINDAQTGYMEGRFIGENIRLISDILHFTAQQNLEGIALFIDFEKAFDSLEWDFLRKTLDNLSVLVMISSLGLKFCSQISPAAQLITVMHQSGLNYIVVSDKVVPMSGLLFALSGTNTVYSYKSFNVICKRNTR